MFQNLQLELRPRLGKAHGALQTHSLDLRVEEGRKWKAVKV